MRLGDLDALKEVITANHYLLSSRNNSIDYGMFTTGIIQAIDNAPTVEAYTIEDIQEVRENALILGAKLAQRPKGEWIDEGQYAEGHSEHAYRCKKCGYHIIELPNMIFENRFCKYCGTDMRNEGGAE